MGDLGELQAWMAGLLRERRALDADESLGREIARRVTGNDRLSPAEQLEIYREQFWLRHTSSLVEDFPGLGGVLGQAEWEKLIERYLSDHAPASWTLRDLGSHLPQYVERATWLSHHALCIDMARLEWIYIELFDAEDAPPLDPEKLAAIPDDAWQTATIVTNPALALLEVRYPVAELRKRLRDKPQEPVPVPEPREQRLVLYRAHDRRLYHKPVRKSAFELLGALAEGITLTAACERAAERCPEEAPEIEAKIGGWFADWGRRGWIVDVVASF